MNIDQLIAALEEQKEVSGGETEVRIAHQPSWPFEYSLGDIVATQPCKPDPEEIEAAKEAAEDGDDGAEQWLITNDVDDHPWVLFIGEGSQLGYLPGGVAGALGW